MSAWPLTAMRWGRVSARRPAEGSSTSRVPGPSQAARTKGGGAEEKRIKREELKK